MKIEAKEK